MTRSPNWRELDAAATPRKPTTTPPAPRRSEESAGEADARSGEPPLGDGPVDGWTDTDEFLSVEP